MQQIIDKDPQFYKNGFNVKKRLKIESINLIARWHTQNLIQAPLLLIIIKNNQVKMKFY